MTFCWDSSGTSCPGYLHSTTETSLINTTSPWMMWLYSLPWVRSHATATGDSMPRPRLNFIYRLLWHSSFGGRIRSFCPRDTIPICDVFLARLGDVGRPTYEWNRLLLESLCFLICLQRARWYGPFPLFGFCRTSSKNSNR